MTALVYSLFSWKRCMSVNVTNLDCSLTVCRNEHIGLLQKRGVINKTTWGTRGTKQSDEVNLLHQAEPSSTLRSQTRWCRPPSCPCPARSSLCQTWTSAVSWTVPCSTSTASCFHCLYERSNNRTEAREVRERREKQLEKKWEGNRNLHEWVNVSVGLSVQL